MMGRISIVVWIIVITIFFSCSEEELTNHSNDYDTIPEPPGWELVWHDEFDGDEIDTNKDASNMKMLITGPVSPIYLGVLTGNV